MILLGRPQWIVIRQVKEADVYVAVVSFVLAGLSDTRTKLFPPDTQMKTRGWDNCRQTDGYFGVCNVLK